MRQQCNVAVLGAGAAGLVAARELLREGHHVTVFEQADEIGGTWLYSDDAEDWRCPGDGKASGSSGQRHVHGSMYAKLRTNLPREIMGFTDFPLLPEVIGAGSVDSRRYPVHEEIQAYLRVFAAHFGLLQHIRLRTQVVAVRPLSPTGAAPMPGSCSGPRWEVRSRAFTSSTAPDSTSGAAAQATSNLPGGLSTMLESFDAVVSCVGNYSVPNLPTGVEGMPEFPGVQLHSHSYRRPEAFTGQVVVVVGASFSGTDIGREVSSRASAVYMSAASWANPLEGANTKAWGPNGNMHSRGMLKRLGADGSAHFERGPPLAHVDVVLYCTGFKYSYPFLQGTGLISTDAQHVSPLYRNMFPPAVAPTLAFVGLSWKSLRFPQFELQSKLVARVLSGAAVLPSRQDMEADMAARTQELLDAGFPLRYTHNQMLSVPMNQYVYNDWLADAAGIPRLPTWRFDTYKVVGQALMTREPDTYRDTWEDKTLLKLLDAGYAEFEQLLPKLREEKAARARPPHSRL